jgi:hypothetical protein
MDHSSLDVRRTLVYRCVSFKALRFQGSLPKPFDKLKFTDIQRTIHESHEVTLTNACLDEFVSEDSKWKVEYAAR